MPLTFPSHQGLILPLWRRFPFRIDAIALCVGAALPDIVDAAAWPFRGRMDHWLGHSFLGLTVCLPIGLMLAWCTRKTPPQKWVLRLDEGAPASPGIARAASSVVIGTLSHDALDSITHEGAGFLWPWFNNHNVFPSWWYQTWATLPLPFAHEPYPLVPQTIMWFLLTIIGAILFVVCLQKPVRSARRPSERTTIL